MKRGLSVLALLAVLLVSCGGARDSETPVTPAPTASQTSSTSPSPSPTPSVIASSADAGSSVSAPSTEAGADAGVDANAKPAPVERTGKTWPFHAWDRAEAFTFNRFPMRPRAPFRIYDDNGWSPHVVDKKPLDAALAKQAVDLVLAGKSELAMTKCPFPRHAVVLYDHEIPVASINVCFSCGDILLWPRWGPPEVDWDKLTDAQKKKALADLEAESARKQKLFAQVFPKWKTFFRDAVGFPIDEKWD